MMITSVISSYNKINKDNNSNNHFLTLFLGYNSNSNNNKTISFNKTKIKQHLYLPYLKTHSFRGWIVTISKKLLMMKMNYFFKNCKNKQFKKRNNSYNSLQFLVKYKKWKTLNKQWIFFKKMVMMASIKAQFLEKNKFRSHHYLMTKKM